MSHSSLSVAIEYLFCDNRPTLDTIFTTFFVHSCEVSLLILGLRVILLTEW